MMKYNQPYNCPVDTRRHFSVYKTSIQRRRHRTEVLLILKRYRLSTGSIHEFFVKKLEFIKLPYKHIGYLFYRYYHIGIWNMEEEKLTKITMIKSSLENLEWMKQTLLTTT